MQSKEPEDLYDRYRGKVTKVLNEVKIQSHVLAEHATIIHTRSELALEEIIEADHPLRTHLNAIRESAGTIVDSSTKLRRLVSE